MRRSAFIYSLFIGLAAAGAAVSPAAAQDTGLTPYETEAETEAEAAQALVLQGRASDIAWTVRFEEESEGGTAFAQIVMTPTDYRDMNVICGPAEMASDGFTVTDTEDGERYAFGLEKHSSSLYRLTVRMTEGDLVIDMLPVDPEVGVLSDLFTLYACADEAGNALTFGVAAGSGVLMACLYDATSDEPVETIWSLEDIEETDDTLRAQAASGDIRTDFAVTLQDGNLSLVTILFDGQEMEGSLVNPAVFAGE